MDDKARVTVVIPAYKAEATIRRAVDSVLAQPGVDTEIVAVVDGVFDRTPQLLASYDPSRVRTLINETNLGPTFARNRGLAAATGEYVMFLDCDDFVEGDMLAGLVRAMRRDEADLGFGPLQILKEGRNVRRRSSSAASARRPTCSSAGSHSPTRCRPAPLCGAPTSSAASAAGRKGSSATRMASWCCAE